MARNLQQAPDVSPGSPGRETPGPCPTYGLGTYTEGLLQLFCSGLVRVPVLQPGHCSEQALLAPVAKKRFTPSSHLWLLKVQPLEDFGCVLHQAVQQ